VSQCEGCAFKPGAAANREPWNRLRSMICALGGIPFYCHHGLDWKRGEKAVGDALVIIKHQAKLEEIGIPKAALLRARLPIKDGEKLHVCGGWRKAVGAIHAAHPTWFGGQDASVRRILALHALDSLEKWAGLKDKKQKAEHWNFVKGAMDVILEDAKVIKLRIGKVFAE
jgi:hypothetical protein